MRAPDKNRFLKAVKHIQCNEIPLFEHEADPAIVSAMLGKPVDMSLHSFELPVPDVIEWNLKMGNDMVYFGNIWRLARKEMVDAAGRRHYVDGMMKTPASLKDIWYPDLGALRGRLEEFLRCIEGTGLGIVVCGTSPDKIVSSAMGYQDFCYAIYENPDFIDDFLARVQEYAMKELEMLLSYPVDGILLTYSLVTSTGSMLNPVMMEKYADVFMKKQAERIKGAGKLLTIHTDGLVEPLMPLFIDMGVDVIHPLDPCGGAQDIYEVKKRWGSRTALQGNIDIGGVLAKGNPEQVAEDVRRHIEGLSADGGYIVASSHDLHQLIPPANIYAMRDAVHGWRK